MAGVGRNFCLAGLLVAVLALAATELPSAMWSCGLAAVLALAGVVLFRGNRWRTGSLLVAALALSLALLDAFAGYLSPTPMGYGLVRTTAPRYWPPSDPILGFRPRPNTEVLATATFGRGSHLTLRGGGWITMPPGTRGVASVCRVSVGSRWRPGIPSARSRPLMVATRPPLTIR